MITQLAKSKTILGIFLTALVALAPEVGISFGTDSAQLISQTWDAVIQAITLGFATYGRIVAKGPIRRTDV
jgi:hypothetical protein